MKSEEKVVFIGGGGHAKVLIDLVRSSTDLHILGIVDPNLKKGDFILRQAQDERCNSGAEVLGDDSILGELLQSGVRHAVVAVGSGKSNAVRKKVHEAALAQGFSLPKLVHHKAIVASDAELSEGVQVMAGAIIQTHCIVGANSIINTGSILEHDCVVGKHVHICPGAVVSGDCRIGDEAFIGAGAVIKQGIRIGKGATVGAGSVVLKDVPELATVVGVPAKPIKKAPNNS